MWYVIQATPEAYLYSGFKQSITPEEYVEKVKDNTFTDTLQRHEVKEGDVFFLPAGRVHAIGAGCFMVEIQQTSNITYRIYDYNRKDAAGNTRELHTDLAKDAIEHEDVVRGHRTGDPGCSRQPRIRGLRGGEASREREFARVGLCRNRRVREHDGPL